MQMKQIRINAVTASSELDFQRLSTISFQVCPIQIFKYDQYQSITIYYNKDSQHKFPHIKRNCKSTLSLYFFYINKKARQGRAHFHAQSTIKPFRLMCAI